MRKSLLVVCVLLCSITSAGAQVSVGIGLPGVSIGINLPVYPQLVRSPATRSTTRRRSIRTISSTTACTGSTSGTTGTRVPGTTGPGDWWHRRRCRCTSCAFPCAITDNLPCTFAAGSRMRRRAGASTGAMPGNSVGRDGTTGTAARVPPAPLPAYQRQYSGNRYPRVEQQQVLQSQHYRYQPQDAVVQQHYQEQRERDVEQHRRQAAGPPGPGPTAGPAEAAEATATAEQATTATAESKPTEAAETPAGGRDRAGTEGPEVPRAGRGECARQGILCAGAGSPVCQGRS